MYKTFYTKKAIKDLDKIDYGMARRIVEKVKFFSQQENPIAFAKRLTDSKYGEYRFRVGDYRIIFDIDNKGNIKILMILAIKHRKEAYI